MWHDYNLHVLLALSILGLDFYVSRANFLTILRSHLNITCSCYFWSHLFNVDVNYSYNTYLVNYRCSLKCIEKNLVNYSNFCSCQLFVLKFPGDKRVFVVLDPHLRRRCTKLMKGFIISIIKSHGIAWATWTSTAVVCHKKGQSLTVLLISCNMLEMTIPHITKKYLMKRAQSTNSNSNNQLIALEICLDYIIEIHQPQINPLMKIPYSIELSFNSSWVW